VVTQTGLYENEIITAYDGSLKKLWEFDSFAETNGSGGHKIEAADVDGDGRQEVFVGTMCLNPDGRLRWSIYRQHPDIVSVHDYLPNRPGLEVFYIVESSPHAGVYMVDAKSGEILWKHNREEDPRWTHGHAGWSADISTSSPGMECASNRAGHDDMSWVLYSSAGKPLVDPFPAGYTPFEWDGDETRELLSADGRTVGNFDGTRIVPLHGLPPNPFPDARVLMTADICGDFRDELILSVNRDKGRKGIAVVMATTPINARFVSRAEDFEYRLWLARNMGGGYRSVFDQPLRPAGNQELTELQRR
jgi:rhamnogalacturonan endolyase